MKRLRTLKRQPAEVLRQAAMQYPEAVAGIACAGTTLEKQTIKVRNKAFLFLGANDAMLKLSDSLTVATELAATEPNRFKVGAHGWVTITFVEGQSPPNAPLKDWVSESYRLLAPKQLVATLSERPKSPIMESTHQAGTRKKRPTS